MTTLHQTLMTGVLLKPVTKCGYCSIWTFVCDTETSLRNKLFLLFSEVLLKSLLCDIRSGSPARSKSRTPARR